MKCGLKGDHPMIACRTPQGVRGLKCTLIALERAAKGVAPRKGCVD